MLAAILVMSTAVSAAGDSRAQVKKTVHAFVAGGDRQDADSLQSVLHADFRVAFVVKGTKKPSMMNRADYLGLIEAKKIGGDSRRVKILSVDVQGELAFVRVRLVGENATFESVQTMVETERGWQLLGESVLFSPKA